MLTEFARDHAFTIGWFGLMTMVWLGWAQEDPPASWRGRLGAGSVLGIVLAGIFGSAVVVRWGERSALEGTYHWFGVIVGLEVLVAGIGCLILARRGQSRWMAWWVALIVALHFAPLACFLRDPSLLILTLVQVVELVLLIPRLRGEEHPTSRLVGPVMGATLLLFAVISAVIFLLRVGSPWG